MSHSGGQDLCTRERERCELGLGKARSGAVSSRREVGGAGAASAAGMMLTGLVFIGRRGRGWRNSIC